MVAVVTHSRVRARESIWYLVSVINGFWDYIYCTSFRRFLLTFFVFTLKKLSFTRRQMKRPVKINDKNTVVIRVKSFAVRRILIPVLGTRYTPPPGPLSLT